ncbi:hypothetical protein IEQ34_010179 [Dendrobium chrysotoxum]|uniref:Uncharacterized protein n=1 Tax=Dendrobium chrysotoxum TaxID=161865 RepID=A0AAV7H4E9_DENCH|nr:hypothetical protein IEQ34_010179 [Dendrobium chrysotoxum]
MQNKNISSEHTKTQAPYEEKTKAVDKTKALEQSNVPDQSKSAHDKPIIPTQAFNDKEAGELEEEVSIIKIQSVYKKHQLDSEGVQEAEIKFRRGDTIFSTRNIIISRRGIDELLSNSYLDSDHVDAFAILLHEKSKLWPNKSLYRDMKEAFDSDINKWRFQTIKGAPTQTNNVDC